MTPRRIIFVIKAELTTAPSSIIAVILILSLIPMEAGSATYDNDTSLDFSWEAASGDVDHYNVYVYVSVDGDEYVLDSDKGGVTFETEYSVENCSDGHSYKIAVEAVDAAGNVGPMSDESDPVTVSLTASYTNITVLLEGPYESGKTMGAELTIPTLSPYADARKVATVPTNAVDWVYVEIRSDETTTVRGESMFLLNDGSIVDRNGETRANFYNLPPSDYYLVIRHRNHLAIMSKFPVSFVQSGDSSVDLTVKDNVYTTGGPNAVKELAPGIYGMYAGDASQDGKITSNDYDIWYNDRIGNKSGYREADMNLSGTISSDDYDKWYNNRLANASSQVP